MYIYIYAYVHGTIEILSALFIVHVNRWVKSNISHELGRLLFLMCFKFGGLYCTLEDCTNLDITWSGGVNGRRNIITNYIINNPKGPQSSQRYQFWSLPLQLCFYPHASYCETRQAIIFSTHLNKPSSYSVNPWLRSFDSVKAKGNHYGLWGWGNLRLLPTSRCYYDYLGNRIWCMEHTALGKSRAF